MRINAEPGRVEVENFPLVCLTRQPHTNTGMRYSKNPTLIYFNLDIIHPILYTSDLNYQGTSYSSSGDSSQTQLPPFKIAPGYQLKHVFNIFKFNKSV